MLIREVRRLYLLRDGVSGRGERMLGNGKKKRGAERLPSCRLSDGAAYSAAGMNIPKVSWVPFEKWRQSSYIPGANERLRRSYA